MSIKLEFQGESQILNAEAAQHNEAWKYFTSMDKHTKWKTMADMTHKKGETIITLLLDVVTQIIFFQRV